MKTEPSIDSLPAKKWVQQAEWYPGVFERTVKFILRIERLLAT